MKKKKNQQERILLKKEDTNALFKVSAQANFAHFCIIFSGCFMDNIYKNGSW